MGASEVPERRRAESAAPETIHRQRDTISTPAVDDAVAGAAQHAELGDDAVIKDEIPEAEEDEVVDESDQTATTLRPAPQPSAKRRESEAGESGARDASTDTLKAKKRKRAPSPPWRFSTADVTTITTKDGRRVSARHQATPTAGSESESQSQSRARSNSRATSQSRPPSPPWKRFAVEGPTTLQVDGKRKSTRVNKLPADESPAQPKRVSPRSKKTVDKLSNGTPQATPHIKAETKALVKEKAALESMRPPSAKGKSATTASTAEHEEKIKNLQAQIKALKYKRSFPAPGEEEEEEVIETKPTHKRKYSKGDAAPSRKVTSPTPQRKHRRSSHVSQSPEAARSGVKLKLRRTPSNYPPIIPPHPNAMPPSPTRPPRRSLYQVIEDFELKEMQQPYSENERGPPSRQEFSARHQKAAEHEAAMRKKLLDAAQPGKPLSVEACSVYRDDQVEPPTQYGHRDHLNSHVLFLRHLQVKEKQNHRALAKKIAYEAVDAWKVRHGPTEEDLIAEADRVFRLVAKQVVTDMRSKWEMVHHFVLERRKQEWEAAEEKKRQERLKRQLEWSESMVKKQRGAAAGSDDENEDLDDEMSDVDGESGADDEDTEDEEESEENMSESGSEGVDKSAAEDQQEEMGEMTSEEMAAYLAQRDAEPPDRGTGGLADLYGDSLENDDEDDESADVGSESSETAAGSDSDDEAKREAEGDETMDDAETAADIMSTTRRRRSSNSAEAEDEQAVEAALSDDQSTDMDSESYDSDEDMSESGDSGSENGSTRSQASTMAPKSNWLYHLLKKDEKAAVDAALPTPMTSAEENNAEDLPEDEEPEEDQTLPDADADGPTTEIDNETIVDPDDEPDVEMDDTEMAKDEDEGLATKEPGLDHADEATSVSAAKLKPIDSLLQSSIPGTPVSQSRSDGQPKPLIPQPSLLRGELRSYQHAGVDWLARLYGSKINGILADEMGLGKTIQTIALLAHLAEQHEVWTTHLIIVPTSVILNWVTEFQKFLPGFRVLGYYGTLEERARKRGGWANDPHHSDKTKRGYNVVVTSYNVAVKDINALRNVKWHYLILDEAHNIRNFQSQMFQSLIRLRTKARLLLTGTPLQNSLTELWALLTFLTAGNSTGASHGTLDQFLANWKEPVKEIFDRGVQTLSAEASKIVGYLHTSLRPYMLRRLKSEVEKDLPKKTEHTVVCKLSKRQRQLYQDYMGLADTKAKLAQGNAVTAGRVLLSLRRVCNHPDLFDPRPIQTSFAMEESALQPFSIKEALVRRMLGARQETPAVMIVVANERQTKYLAKRSKQLSATIKLQQQAHELEKKVGSAEHDLSTVSGCQAFQHHRQRQNRLRRLRDAITYSDATIAAQPIYGSDLRERLTVRSTRASAHCSVLGRLYVTTPSNDPKISLADMAKHEQPFDKFQSQSTIVQSSLPTLTGYGERYQDILVRFVICTPEATSPILDLALPPKVQKLIRAQSSYPEERDFAHEARIRNSIVFPDSRLLIYDSGKLQRLVHLLRDLQAKGSRSLIFSQMTLTLDILEQFLNLLNLPYLRLDGSTPIERRQLYSAEFNNPDSKYQVMILSSRAGGVGLNLTGASSVIFYDLDWNPQMDKQCMDRAHRIGQVRDVEVYKMVSEKTVEENILRRANQKSLLDQTVIQEGHFTTDYDLAAVEKDSAGNEKDDDVTVAIDRLFAGGDKAGINAIESVEDVEDVAAAQAARKEEALQDADDFADAATGPSSKAVSVPPTPGVDAKGEEDEGRKGHVDGYMIKFMEVMMRDVAFVPPPPVGRRLDRNGRDPSHRPKRRR